MCCLQTHNKSRLFYWCPVISGLSLTHLTVPVYQVSQLTYEAWGQSKDVALKNVQDVGYSHLPNVKTKRKEPHTCTIGWNIDSNEPHVLPGLYSSDAFVVIKALPISSSKWHIVLNKPHASLFGLCFEMNKPSVRNKATGCYISQSRVIDLPSISMI